MKTMGKPKKTKQGADTRTERENKQCQNNSTRATTRTEMENYMT